MAKKFLVPIDLTKQELLNARVQNLASAPSSPVSGQIYYDTDTDLLGVYNGATWDYMGTGGGISNVVEDTTPQLGGDLDANGNDILLDDLNFIQIGNQADSVRLKSDDTNFGSRAIVLQPADDGTGTVDIATPGDLIISSNTGIDASGDWYPSLSLTQDDVWLSVADGGTFNFYTDGGPTKGIFDFSGLDTTDKTFIFPNDDGTIALTSDLHTHANQGILDATTASFTTADETKLDGIEAGADVTDATNVNAAGALMESEVDADIKTLSLPASTTISTFGASLIDDAAASDARSTLGLVIGTNVLAPNGDGSALTGITQSQVASLTSDLALKAPLASPTFTGTVTVPTPSSATDATTKGYVDNLVQGLSWKQAVRVATTTTGTLATAYENGDTVDGVTLATGDRILIKNQGTGAENGIYVVAASGAPARASDANTSAEIDSMTVYVESGTANADTVWTLTTDNPTLDSTTLVYAQVNGGALPSASTIVEGKVELATQAEAQAKTDTTRALTAASVADFARKYTATIGDNSATSIAVTHGLGSQYVTAQVFDASSGAMVECDITLTSGTQTTFDFSVAPTTNQYRVVITG